MGKVMQQQRLDPNVLKIGPKAYMSDKLTDMTREEAQDAYKEGLQVGAHHGGLGTVPCAGLTNTGWS